MSKDKILLVEDEPDLLQTLAFNFENEGYEVAKALDGKEAIKFLEDDDSISLVILDLMLPDMSGLDICRRIRAADNLKDILVIMVTAKGEEVDRVVGFEVGADDYVVKPYSVRELLLRVGGMLKRSSKENQSNDKDLVEFEDLKIDNNKHKVYLSDEKISLTSKEFKLLKHLLLKADKVQSRDNLLEKVWGYNNDVTTRTVDTHIKRLRSKIGKYGDKIETIRGEGYLFNKSE
ncbi:MAG: response regulator transcription factor [Pseudomonadota bacterium]|nr:response regulator transcription factor [SAR86 cluster bacterium]MEC7268681.1 response regulator transcription factor [Pseudomonadota bacterium]MEC7465172.1 response regulator transcription factor [Pseudomonadota bacterium]MEC7787004.1 response regulator transcription factor [Pseudomonadota bacterium]MEC8107901.1 response regulator transcription factor [Pseudomonadota bacterium]